MSKIIREYCKESDTCVLRANYYNKRLSHFLRMFEMAKQDFPNLTPEDVTVVVYGGDRHKYQGGIEFTPPSKVPESYESIYVLELTLG